MKTTHWGMLIGFLMAFLGLGGVIFSPYGLFLFLFFFIGVCGVVFALISYLAFEHQQRIERRHIEFISKGVPANKKLEQVGKAVKLSGNRIEKARDGDKVIGTILKQSTKTDTVKLNIQDGKN